MDESRLMIVMGDSAWTLAVLHLACVMSRRGKTDVLLLKMIPVRHPLLLGTEAGYLDFTAEDALALEDMAATAEDYGVSLDMRVFQYASYWSGVVDAAAQLGVTAVILRIPPSPIPHWQDFRRWWLRQKLARQQQMLLTLEDMTPSLTWTPTIALQDNMARMLERRQP